MRTFSAFRIAGVAALVSLAACADNAPTGVDTPLALKGGTSATRSAIVLSAPAGAPYAAAKGKAKYDAGNPELQIEAENIPAGTSVKFMAGNTQVGTGTASALGAVKLVLRGAAAGSKPASASVVRADGAVIVSGSF